MIKEAPVLRKTLTYYGSLREPAQAGAAPLDPLVGFPLGCGFPPRAIGAAPKGKSGRSQCAATFASSADRVFPRFLVFSFSADFHFFLSLPRFFDMFAKLHVFQLLTVFAFFSDFLRFLEKLMLVS